MSFQLTRVQMTKLLYALKGESVETPLHIIREALKTSTFTEEVIPNFLIKASNRKNQLEYGLSTNEIVSLANLCELTSLKSTSIQNWIKRDVKELIGQPDLGKKYSIEQAAMLLIVRDLKAIFDFERIRNILTEVFNTLSDRSDDLMSPITFYEIYGSVLESLDTSSGNNLTLEKRINSKIKFPSQIISNLSNDQCNTIRRILVTTVLAVLASHIQTRAQTYLNDI
ncbi:DUF1836 domain-containing protein [Metabacillus halosaccharovorans]|uniref:DUF1836 domain-containing protein n=1 Tax=Metabacillus halosaccharovorans TaxID=930124 RepID=UPI001C1FA78E|nr:DUF1836 domain-containing protein [Metabacillus halosaccharovorans]MBU7591812.1 DUF1836 domain-containing protein [Metabacillus halosaccharovorans]